MAAAAGLMATSATSRGHVVAAGRQRVDECVSCSSQKQRGRSDSDDAAAAVGSCLGVYCADGHTHAVRQIVAEVVSVLVQSVNCAFAASNRLVLHFTQRFTNCSIVISTKHARCLFTVHPAAAAVLTAAQSSSAAWSFLHIENELLDIVLLMLGSHRFTCGSAHLLQLTLNKGGGRRGLCTEGVLDCGADGGSNNGGSTCSARDMFPSFATGLCVLCSCCRRTLR